MKRQVRHSPEVQVDVKCSPHVDVLSGKRQQETKTRERWKQTSAEGKTKPDPNWRT